MKFRYDFSIKQAGSTMNIIYKNHLKNELGTLCCELFSNITSVVNIIESKQSVVIKTASHVCELLRVELKDDWLPKGMSTEESFAWLWMIKKVDATKEELTLKCYLKPTCNVTSESDTGECLDALAIESETKVMHLGTEDADVLCSRAKNSNNFLSPTEYLDYGFKTNISTLEESEVVYFQYLYALNSRKKSEQYPNEEDVSTWFAVERDREFILKKLGIQFTI